jgi:hypothetical protein
VEGEGVEDVTEADVSLLASTVEIPVPRPLPEGEEMDCGVLMLESFTHFLLALNILTSQIQKKA